MNDHELVSSVGEVAIGDSLYVENTGKTFWIKSISANRVELVDVDGRTETWVRETLEAAFEAHTWVRQARNPARLDHPLD